MNYIGQILEKKGSRVWSTTPSETVFNALKLMAEKNIGALLVTENNKLMGIFSERDYARKVILQGKSSKELSVGEIMTSNVIYVSPTETLDNCMFLMTSKKIRHIPVLENDSQLVGLISIGDVVEGIIDKKEFIIEQLVHYIHDVR